MRGPRHRYHFGAPTLVYMFISLLLALGAFNSQNNLLFWALGFSFASMLVSGLLSGRMLMGLRAVRLNSPAGHAGEVVAPAYRVLNANRFVPGFALTVQDLTLMESASRKAARKPERGGIGRDDRPYAVVERPGFVQHVSSRGHSDSVARVRLLRRGVVKLRTLRVETSFPFGLIRKAIDFDVRGELVVWPRLVELDPNTLSGGMQAGSSPRTPSRRRGEGDEFFALREYAEGDSPRNIAWRVSAQRMSIGSPEQASLFVRQTVAPSPSRLWIVLDRCGDETLDERAISMAATLATIAHDRGMMFGLSEPASNVLVTPASGRGHMERLFDALARLTPLQSTAVADSPEHRLPPKAATADGTMCVVVHGRSGQGLATGLSNIGGRMIHLSADDEALKVFGASGATDGQGASGSGVDGRGRTRGPAHGPPRGPASESSVGSGSAIA